MTFTYDLNTNGCLIIRASDEEREMLKELANQMGEFDYCAERDALESLICNSELEWISPEEIGALTDAPILGIRDSERELPANVNPTFTRVTSRTSNGKLHYEPVIAAWGFMDYAVRSFVQDLIDTGEAVFVS